jgi:hypothetical protein
MIGLLLETASFAWHLFKISWPVWVLVLLSGLVN